MLKACLVCVRGVLGCGRGVLGMLQVWCKWTDMRADDGRQTDDLVLELLSTLMPTAIEMLVQMRIQTRLPMWLLMMCSAPCP